MRYLKKFENYSEESTSKTIVDIIVGSKDHQILKKAVLACGLEKTLASGEFTVFAPTDEAFKKLPAGTVEGLLEDTEALSNILLYHATPGKALSTSLQNGQIIETANGDELMIQIVGDEVFVNDAKVVAADLEAVKGVVHVIDSVLMP